jgi:hypothetical protein
MIPFLLVGTSIQNLPKQHPFLNKLLPRAFGKLKECYSDVLRIHEAFSQKLGFVLVPTNSNESGSGKRTLFLNYKVFFDELCHLFQLPMGLQ